MSVRSHKTNPATIVPLQTDRRRAKWKTLTHRARRSKNGEAFLEISEASAAQCSTGALLRMLRHGGSQPRIKEGASHHARRGKNAEAFLIF